MSDPLTKFSTLETPQTRAADTRQSPNSAGGYTFTVSDMEALRRFLIIGTEGGTYYAGQDDLTLRNAQLVVRLAETRGRDLVETIAEVSIKGLSPKPNPGLFALAIAASHGDAETRKLALEYLPAVARTGTHLFTFAGYVQQFRGWGRGLRRAVAKWYADRPADKLAYQALKYRHRKGWTHRDLLRLSHPRARFSDTQAVLSWIAQGEISEDTPRILRGYLKAQETDNPVTLSKLIRDYGLSWEMLPTEALRSPMVWETLIAEGLPQTALIRNLPRLTAMGILEDPGIRRTVADQIKDAQRLSKARVHPISVLMAQRTYSAGRSVMGSLEWAPRAEISDALDEAFYNSFGAVETSGKRTLLALDVSGSMGFSAIPNTGISAREASAALAMVQMSREDVVDVIGFTGSDHNYLGWGRGSGVSSLDISPRRRLDDNLAAVSGLPFGRTDCALPMTHALEKGLKVDTFVIYTDNETYAGQIHPHQALAQYRKETGIDARLVVVGMVSTGFTIADPSDPGMLDVVGFDASTPQVISSFSAQ